MRKKSTPEQIVFVLLTALIILSCNGGVLAVTATPVPSTTSEPTNTATPKPTITPTPTATEIPPTPTPMPMGTPVSSADYEVNVVYMRTLETVYLDTQYHWVPTAGNMFVELGIKVVNLKPGSKVSVPWGHIHVTEKSGGVWYPNWGEFKPVASGVEFNPKKLVFRNLDNPDELVVFDEVAYVRAIYGVARLSPTTLLFVFGDSPQIKVVVP